MQMLSAGGMPLLSDDSRAPDANNPRGYYEWALVKSLSRSSEVIEAAEGKVVKVISYLLQSLPNQHEYRVIFMCRPLEEVVASQDKMLERLGKAVPSAPKKSVISAFERHLKDTRVWLAKQPNMAVLYVSYISVLDAPEEAARTVSRFLGGALNIEAMASQVEQSLYREKPGQGGSALIGL